MGINVMVTCFIAFCCVLIVAILKFRSVTVEHTIKVNVSARSGSKGANRRRIADKYARRIIDASEIFKQIKGVINLNI
jgi:hypothetical protein